MAGETWSSGEAYEAFMGRWSRQLASSFVAWLDPEPGASWLDVGCGTGALAAAIAADAAPGELVGIDAAEPYVAHAAEQLPQARFLVADAQALPFEDGRFDAAVSGLVLNFLPDPAAAAREIARVVRPGGAVAAYVWDYGGGMEFLRRFWDTVADLDPGAAALDEGRRFALADRDRLAGLLAGAGFEDVRTDVLTVPTVFESFDDLWQPFLGGQGPAPGYVVSLSEVDRERLAAALRERLEPGEDGRIHLSAHALAARGARP